MKKDSKIVASRKDSNDDIIGGVSDEDNDDESEKDEEDKKNESNLEKDENYNEMPSLVTDEDKNKDSTLKRKRKEISKTLTKLQNKTEEERIEILQDTEDVTREYERKVLSSNKDQSQFSDKNEIKN